MCPVLEIMLAILEEPAERSRFERLYYGYRQQMFWVAMKILCQEQDAEDAVQDAFLALSFAMERVPDYPPQVERAYLLTAAKHAALKLKRVRDFRWKLLELSEIELASGSDEVLHRVCAKLDVAYLQKCVDQLSAPYREVLALVCFLGVSCAEAAVLLGRKEATVRKQLERGRKQLLDRCRKEGMIFG